MSSVAAISNARTVIVQTVAFSEPEWQLPRYLETMEDAGLRVWDICLCRRHFAELGAPFEPPREYSEPGFNSSSNLCGGYQ